MDLKESAHSASRPPPHTYEVVGVITGVVLGFMRGASGHFADAAAAAHVGLSVVVLGMTTAMLREPEGVAL